MLLNGFRRIALAQGLLPAAARTAGEESQTAAPPAARQPAARMELASERAVQAAQIRSVPASR